MLAPKAAAADDDFDQFLRSQLRNPRDVVHASLDHFLRSNFGRDDHHFILDDVIELERLQHQVQGAVQTDPAHLQIDRRIGVDPVCGESFLVQPDPDAVEVFQKFDGLFERGVSEGDLCVLQQGLFDSFDQDAARFEVPRDRVVWHPRSRVSGIGRPTCRTDIGKGGWLRRGSSVVRFGRWGDRDLCVEQRLGRSRFGGEGRRDQIV